MIRQTLKIIELTAARRQGISVQNAAARILHAREGYREAYGAATGKLARLRDQVGAAETI